MDPCKTKEGHPLIKLPLLDKERQEKGTLSQTTACCKDEWTEVPDEEGKEVAGIGEPSGGQVVAVDSLK